jgi:cytochrome c biogenesis protein CcdA
MLTVAVLVASIGLADSINPSTVGPALLLATGRRAVLELASFILGVFAVSVAAGLAVVLGPGQVLLDSLPHPSPWEKHVAELVGGAALLVLALVLWLRRQDLARRLVSSGSGEGEARRSALALGAGLMAVELPTALPYFAALAAILTSRASLAGRGALVVLFNLAFVAPLLAILALRALAGERASEQLERAGSWLRGRAVAVVAILLALVGAGALVVGLLGLA